MVEYVLWWFVGHDVMTPKLYECCDFIVLLSAEARVEEVSWRLDEITAYV
jgi:hypothetical protein